MSRWAEDKLSGESRGLCPGSPPGTHSSCLRAFGMCSEEAHEPGDTWDLTRSRPLIPPCSPSPGSPNSPWAWSGMCPSSPYMCINSRFPGSYGDCLVSSRGSNIDCLRKLGLFMAALPSGSETWVLPVCPPTAGRVGHRGAEQTPVGESVPKEKSSDTFLQNGNTYAITS